MQCPVCNESIKDDARFCPKCGTRLTDVQGVPQSETPLPQHQHEHPLTYDDYVRYNERVRREAEHQKRLEEAQRNFTAALAKYEKTHGTFIACLTLGIVLGLIFGAVFFIGIGNSEHSDSSAAVTSGIFVFFLALDLSFGIAWVAHMVKALGLVACGTITFLVLLFALTIMVAACAGLPYFIYLLYELHETKKERDACGEILHQLERQAV